MNPRYTKMSPEEILGKFVSERLMVREARYINDNVNGPLPHYEPQTVALKATTKKEALPDKVAQIKPDDLNEDKMVLVLKRFKTALKGCKDYPNKNKSRGSVHASSVVSRVILLLNVPIMKMTRTKTRKGEEEVL
jgi:hypothetical protein